MSYCTFIAGEVDSASPPSYVYASAQVYVKGGVGLGTGEGPASPHRILLKHADWNQVKSSLCLKGEKSVAGLLVLGTTKC